MNEFEYASAWIEVSLEVTQELAEPVASALGEIIPEGVVIERVFGDVFPKEMDEIIGPIRVYGYLPVDDQLEERRLQINRALYFLGRISPLPEPSYAPLKAEDWTTAWQQGYEPIPLGSDLIVVPSWLENPDPARTAIFMDPGRAFGSGTHPSTQLGLILIQESLAEEPAERMIDIGCGSGILSIAAVKMQVGYVLGVDTDLTAVQTAEKNARKNQAEEATHFALGSVREILQKEFEIETAPLVVVNMIVPLLEKLLEAGLKKVVSPGGILILSGILEDQIDNLQALLYHQGLKIKTRRQQGEWIALALRSPA